MADALPFTRPPTPVEREAIAEVAAAMARRVRPDLGRGDLKYPELAPDRDLVPLASLPRREQFARLEYLVDWERHLGRGMSWACVDLITANAVDGKPPELWLTETAAERELRAVEMAGIEAMADREILGGLERGGRRFDDMLAGMKRRAPDAVSAEYDAMLREVADSAPGRERDRGMEMD